MSKQLATEPTHKPLHTIRHRAIKATIWRNPTEKGDMFNVTVTRSYRDGEEWHDSNSFSYDDLMIAAKLMYDAHSFITELRAKESAIQSRSRSPAR